MLLICYTYLMVNNKKDKTMNRTEFRYSYNYDNKSFETLCNNYHILPAIALENQNIRDILIHETDPIMATSLIREILINEF